MSSCGGTAGTRACAVTGALFSSCGTQTSCAIQRASSTSLGTRGVNDGNDLHVDGPEYGYSSETAFVRSAALTVFAVGSSVAGSTTIRDGSTTFYQTFSREWGQLTSYLTRGGRRGGNGQTTVRSYGLRAPGITRTNSRATVPCGFVGSLLGVGRFTQSRRPCVRPFDNVHLVLLFSFWYWLSDFRGSHGLFCWELP